MKYCARFDADAFKQESVWRAFYADSEWCLVVYENAGSENPHYHAAFERPTKIGRTRELFVGKTYEHLSRRGNGAYSLKYMDESKEDEFVRYLMKCERRMPFDEFSSYMEGKLINSTHRTLEDLHHAHMEFWQKNQELRSDSTNKKAPTFSKHLVDVFTSNYLEQYMRQYINNDNYDGFASDHKRRRLEFLAKIVLKELNAETKVFDLFIVKRFVLLLENKFNPTFSSKFASQVATSIMDFGE